MEEDQPSEPRRAEDRLTEDGLLASDLWVDAPDALDHVDIRHRAGELSDEQATRLEHFIKHGYLTLPLSLDSDIYQRIQDSVEQLWREKPAHVAYSYQSPLKPFSVADEERDRKPSYRIADLHAFSEAAFELYLNREIFDYLYLIFDQRPVATQSLYFEFGSQQLLHRDPVHVYMRPPSHLVAAWIALEDIQPGCGPLTYVPGSHRCPYYEIEPGEYRFNHYEHGDDESRAMAKFDLEECQRQGLEVEPFLPKQGEVLLWHHSLLHGGSYPEDPALTRNSFVVHYTTMGRYDASAQSVLLPDEDGAERLRGFQSFQVIGRDRCYGFDTPLRALAK